MLISHTVNKHFSKALQKIPEEKAPLLHTKRTNAIIKAHVGVKGHLLKGTLT
jgi:hypothetical protein